MMFGISDMNLVDFQSMLTNGTVGVNAVWIILAVSVLVFLFSSLVMVRGDANSLNI